MSVWQATTLGDVCELKRGYDLPQRDRRDGPYPIVSSSGTTGYHAEAKVKGPGVVTGRYGTLGQVFLVDKDFWPLNTSLYVRDFKGNEPRFVAALLQSMDLGQHDGAAAVPGLNRNQLHQLPVRCPDRVAQLRISEILRSIDDLIENNRRRIVVLEEMAQAIYREWFVHFRCPGHEDANFVDSPLGPIPEGWEAEKLARLVTTQYGYTESAAQQAVGPKYLRGMDINKTSYIDWSSVPYCPISQSDFVKFRIEIGDVFVIRMADPGKIGFCEEIVDAVFASYLVRIRSTDERLTPIYLFFTLNDSPYQDWVTGASTGATRKSVSAKVMTEPHVIVPPSVLLDQFSNVVGPIRTNLTALLKSSSRLTAIRDLLLPKLVTGEIDVSSLDLDALVGSVA